MTESNVRIRNATEGDAADLARMRMLMWEEMNPAARADESYVEQLAAYWRRMLDAQLAVGWVAEADGEMVGSAMLLIHEHPARPGVGAIVRGYVTSVYVMPELRRNGVGRRLMETLIADARERGVQRLELRTSHMARPLYEQVGFEPAEFLVLRLE